MPSFSITSYNALWGHTPDHRPYDLAAVVAGFDTDLVALQEVWTPDDRSSDLPARARSEGYQLVHVPLSDSTVDPRPEITHRPDEGDGTWGVVLLSRLPIARTRIVDLGRLVERWDVAQRLAIIAEVAVGDRTVAVAVHHLSFVVPNAAAQLRRLGHWLPTDRPTVVAGDCNLWGPLAARLVGGHRRAVRGRTWPAHRPHSQLDHILVSPAIRVRTAAVLAPAGSDHRPVQATLEVEG